MKNNIEIPINKDNCRFPSGEDGKNTLKKMNESHNPGALWAIEKLALNLDKNANLCILDIGCGGGQNLLNLSASFQNATLFGIDYSPTSIEFSKKICASIANRLTLKQADVHKTGFEDSKFDIISAFETLYFWENLDIAFGEIKRILKKNGKFMIFLEGTTKETLEIWGKEVFLKNQLNANEIKEILNKNGFLNVEIFTKTNSEKTCLISKL